MQDWCSRVLNKEEILISLLNKQKKINMAGARFFKWFGVKWGGEAHNLRDKSFQRAPKE